MPLIVAFVVSLGSFFGYVAHDTRPDKPVVAYLQTPVKHRNAPYLAVKEKLNVQYP